MSKIKKLFGGINMTWPKVLLFSVITAVYTGLINQVPFFEETSFRDIAVSFEWWILFAIIIITNCKSPLDSALKTFVFFVISQPLIYLVEVPFLGWGVLGYYQNWIVWTLLTFPMAFIGWYIKKNNILSVIILSFMTVFLGVHAVAYFQEALQSFPNHILSSIFCVVQIVVLILCLFDRLRERALAFGIAVVVTAAACFFIMNRPMNFRTNMDFAEDNLAINENWHAQLQDENIGSAYIYNNSVTIDFKNPGETQLVLTDESGKDYYYSVSVDKDCRVDVEKE